MLEFSILLKADESLKLQAEVGAELRVTGIATPDRPETGKLCFVKDAKLLTRLEKNLGDARPVLVIHQKLWDNFSAEEKTEWLSTKALSVLTSPDVPVSMALLSKVFRDQLYESFNDVVDGRQLGTAEIHPTAIIAQHAFIASNVVIEKNVIIHSGVRILSGCRIAEGTELFPNCTIYHQVSIGRNCRIHSGSVIGADGFGYQFNGKAHLKIWHMGGVVIGDDVEVGACSAIDQGTFTPTLIGDNCKIDNHVQIGHNCKLGRGVILCGHVALGGSTELGDYTVFGGKSGIGDGRVLGAGCQVAGGALVNADWPAGTVLGGHPARPLKEWMKGVAYVRKLSLEK
jgi:UDP-3-O-[3-hydroxymyristoyl] glucosamine N-acyltransferase